MEEEKTSIRDELKEMRQLLAEGVNKKKPKAFRLPLRAKLSKGKLKKGYVTVQVIDDNKGINFVREPIIDGTIKLDGTFHAIEEYDILNYQGKPFIIQPKSKLNPYNPLEGKHETYGQKYIMARMEGDKIITKKQIGWGISILGLIIGVVIIYAVFFGGGA